MYLHKDERQHCTLGDLHNFASTHQRNIRAKRGTREATKTLTPIPKTNSKDRQHGQRRRLSYSKDTQFQRQIPNRDIDIHRNINDTCNSKDFQIEISKINISNHKFQRQTFPNKDISEIDIFKHRNFKDRHFQTRKFQRQIFTDADISKTDISKHKTFKGRNFQTEKLQRQTFPNTNFKSRHFQTHKFQRQTFPKEKLKTENSKQKFNEREIPRYKFQRHSRRKFQKPNSKSDSTDNSKRQDKSKHKFQRQAIPKTQECQ